MSDPTKRFTGLAEIYAQARPTYPEEAIQCIISQAGLREGCVIVDIGCGTGISTRLFARRGFKVIGIEPNEDMLQKARAEKPQLPIEYRYGTAEDTGLEKDSVDLVLAAQAFHWFRPSEALTHFHAILKKGAWVALMWNERDERDPFTAGYGDALRMNPETNKVELPRLKAGEPLLTFPLFSNQVKESFSNSQHVDENGLINRAFSASYAPKDEEGKTRLQQKLKQLFAEYNKDGYVDLRYETSIYFGRK
ncbi:MAG TPA: class I SAM-dependent methyltransferase [Candidatus Obscuribacterales bacterium]